MRNHLFATSSTESTVVCMTTMSSIEKVVERYEKPFARFTFFFIFFYRKTFKSRNRIARTNFPEDVWISFVSCFCPSFGWKVATPFSLFATRHRNKNGKLPFGRKMNRKGKFIFANEDFVNIYLQCVKLFCRLEKRKLWKCWGEQPWRTMKMAKIENSISLYDLSSNDSNSNFGMQMTDKRLAA